MRPLNETILIVSGCSFLLSLGRSLFSPCKRKEECLLLILNTKKKHNTKQVRYMPIQDRKRKLPVIQKQLISNLGKKSKQIEYFYGSTINGPIFWQSRIFLIVDIITTTWRNVLSRVKSGYNIEIIRKKPSPAWICITTLKNVRWNLKKKKWKILDSRLLLIDFHLIKVNTLGTYDSRFLFYIGLVRKRRLPILYGDARHPSPHPSP
jgi:hypothetical protein